jgi:adenosylcobinamide-GDP ribazoletransferase
VRGLALAFSWLTVLPVRVAAPDARTAAAALRWAPLVGGLVGAATGAVLVGLVAVGVPVAVAGLLAVGFAALATRGMHLDGLADTADGLGCYGPPERALAVMRDGGAGPFAVVTLLVVVGAQAMALAALAAPLAAAGTGLVSAATSVAGPTGTIPAVASPAGTIPAVAGPIGTLAAGAGPTGTLAAVASPTGTLAAVASPTGTLTAIPGPTGTLAAGAAPTPAAVEAAGNLTGAAGVLTIVAAAALAGAAGRAAFLWVARRGVPAARPGGLGATVAGSQPWWVAVAWWVVLAGAGFALVGPRGVLAVGLGAAVVAALSWHTARRFGGMTGDVLGAASELATLAALVVLAAR